MKLPATIAGQPVQAGVPLGPLTTYQIGGPAEYFVEVHSADQLAAAIEAASSAGVPFFLLGTGANILIRDKGIRGLVIYNRAGRAQFTNHMLTAESGATMAELIELSRKFSLSGLEHFAGIPSSVGGAMRQNLHFLAPDRQRTLFIEEVVESAEILDEQGNRRVVDRDFFAFGYDDSILHHSRHIVLSATFRLSPADPVEIEQQAVLNLQWRRAKQPQLDQFPSCGSVFKKIEGVGAGRLIDQVGLKGKQIGGAQISAKHANFIVNLGGATAADVLSLVELAQRTVMDQTGHWLEMEAGVVGED